MTRHIVVYNVPTTYADIALQQVIDVGCVSMDGVCKTPSGDIWFPSETGYKSLVESLGTESTIDIKDVTALIGPHYRNSLKVLSDHADMNSVYYQRLNHFYFTLPFTSNQEIWVISEDLRVATKGRGNIAGHYEGITSYSFLEKKNGDLLFGSNDGHIYLMDDGTNDDGAAIDFEVEKTGLYYGNPKIFKAPREFESLLEATTDLTATLEWSFDTPGLSSGIQTESISVTTDASPWDTSPWDTSSWDGSGQLLFKSRNLRGRGKTMNVALKHSTLDAKLSFPYWIISLFMQGDK